MEHDLPESSAAKRPLLRCRAASPAVAGDGARVVPGRAPGDPPTLHVWRGGDPTGPVTWVVEQSADGVHWVETTPIVVSVG